MNANEGTSSVLTDRQGKFLGFVLCCAGVSLLWRVDTALVYVLNLAFDLFSGSSGRSLSQAHAGHLVKPNRLFFEKESDWGVLPPSFCFIC